MCNGAKMFDVFTKCQELCELINDDAPADLIVVRSMGHDFMDSMKKVLLQTLNY